MPDFSLYQGLQRKSNIFETKAQNRQMELQVLQAMDQRSEMKLQKQAEIDAKVEEFYGQVQELELLEQDKDRVAADEKIHRQGVLNVIKEYGGDMNAFAMGGGMAALQKYQNNLMNGEAVRGAIANKTNMAQWSHAQANGLWVKPVAVEVDGVDEDGNPIKVKKRVSMDEAHKMFENKQIDKLPWDGAEQDVDVGPEFFQKLFKDPANPYSSDNKVHPNDIANMVRNDGGSESQANQKAQVYQQYIDGGGTPWTYKTGDPLKAKLLNAQISGQRMKNQAMRAATQKTPNLILDASSRIKNMKVGQEVNILEEEWDFLKGPTALGLTYDKENNTWKADPSKGIQAMDWFIKGQNESPASYDLSMFDRLTPLSFVKDPKTGAPMMKFKAEYQSTGAFQDDEPVREDFWGMQQFKDGAHLNNWTKMTENWGDDVYSGEILVPIEKHYDAWSRTYMNKEIGLKSNAWNYPNSGAVTAQEEAMYQFDNVIDQSAKMLMNEIGVSYEDAANMISGRAMYDVQPNVGRGDTQTRREAQGY